MSSYKYLMNTGGIQYENKLNHSKTNIEMREECDKVAKTIGCYCKRMESWVEANNF
jgi:hypothetical protein